MRIWRYIDLGKFISLLVTESLYFACPCEFDDLAYNAATFLSVRADAIELAVQASSSATSRGLGPSCGPLSSLIGGNQHGV